MTRRLGGPLIYAGENDYILPEECTSVWLTVDDISVYIYRVGDEVAVELLPHYDEVDAAPLDSCSTRRSRGGDCSTADDDDLEEEDGGRDEGSRNVET